mgnify:CR=1 FL=1
MAFRSIFRLRPILRLLLLGIFTAIGTLYAGRALYAEAHYFLTRYAAESPEQALGWLGQANEVWPLNAQIRSARAYYYTSFKLYDTRKQAIAEISEYLKTDPFAADLWLALAAYELADGNEAAAKRAIAKIQALRPGLDLVEMVP